MPENQLFMRGVLSWVGFKTAIVEFKRPDRATGTTKYTNWKSFEYALNGITSFSTFPLRIWTYAGVLISGTSFLYAIYIIIAKLLNKSYVAGYPSLMVAILFLAGVQLIGIGTLGEYIGKIYSESKRRPKFIVRNVVSKEKYLLDK